ncbi:MAG: tRNA pseudouridine(55) synthase TruB [Candidatus Melainabacteria bacterium]|nr:MAG: tRNA pseudouridine(55) synthase TruB [Candidatus Melainabacteria bacterium]
MLGFVNVSKPAGMTSHDVVKRLRKLSGIKQVGHAGTLDPAATGVLPIALGKACRLLRFLTSDKIYLAEILLGKRTTTDDTEGEVLDERPIGEHVPASIKAAVTELIGVQDQVPPAYSAIHHDGKRLYELARAGNVPTDVKARRIKVDSIDILAVDLPVIRLRVHCSGGTYIRSIARDLGEKLSCGACLKGLVREQSGPFALAQAQSLEALNDLADADRLAEVVIPPQKVLSLPQVSVDRETAGLLAMGQYLPLMSLPRISERDFNSDKLCLAMLDDSIVAVCSATQDNRLRPEVVLTHAKSLV